MFRPGFQQSLTISCERSGTCVSMSSNLSSGITNILVAAFRLNRLMFFRDTFTAWTIHGVYVPSSVIGQTFALI